MKVETFLKARRSQWEQLETYVQNAQTTLARFSAPQLDEFANLYRSAASDLALAQRLFPDQQITQYLNQLVTRAHGILYRQPAGYRGQIWRYFTQDFPRLFRAYFAFFWVAATLLIIPVIFAGILTYLQPQSARYLLPESAVDLLPIIEEGELWVDIKLEERPAIAGFIASNNIRVSFLAFAGGLTFGIVTIYSLISNGLMLGALLGYTARFGLGWQLAEFVVAHGVLELTVIILAGATGLMLAWAIFRPGEYSRTTALQLAARPALQLVLMAIPLLLLAGAVEGNISPAEIIPAWGKWLIGWSLGALFYVYVGSMGRKPKQVIDGKENGSDF